MSPRLSPKALAAFRADNPMCTLAIWSDIRAGTVLAVDATLEVPQEYLDAFSATASQVLAAPCVPHAEDTCVLLANDIGLQVFAQSQALPYVALICVTPAHAQAGALQRAATAFLADFDKKQVM